MIVNYVTDIMTICVEISRHQTQSEQCIVSLAIDHWYFTNLCGHQSSLEWKWTVQCQSSDSQLNHWYFDNLCGNQSSSEPKWIVYCQFSDSQLSHGAIGLHPGTSVSSNAICLIRSVRWVVSYSVNTYLCIVVQMLF